MVGLKFSNVTETINNYTFATGLVMLVVSFFVFTLLAFYMDAVLPRTYGERRGCCFCITCCCRRGHQQVDEDQFNEEEQQRRSTLRNTDSKGGAITDPFETKYIDS